MNALKAVVLLAALPAAGPYPKRIPSPGTAVGTTGLRVVEVQVIARVPGAR